MEEIEVQSTEGVSTESSSSTPELAASSESAASSGNVSQEAKSNPDSSSNTPFHEHPRWKELIEQRNQFQTEMQKMQERLADYENRNKAAAAPTEATPEQKMLERLKSIDPEFAKYNESIYSKLSKFEQMEQQWQAQQQETQKQAVQSQLQSLHDQNKVPAEYRDMYRDLIRVKATETGAKAADLPNIYKSVHDNFSKILEAVKRSERASYVTNKKSDSNIPSSQPKGNPAKAPSNNKKEWSKDPDTAKMEVISRTMESLRSQRSG